MNLYDQVTAMGEGHGWPDPEREMPLIEGLFDAPLWDSSPGLWTFPAGNLTPHVARNMRSMRKDIRRLTEDSHR
jgi:hypothetical protein